MAEEDRKFLTRWSRRKEEAREGGEAPADDPSTAEDDSRAAKGDSPDLPEAAPDEAAKKSPTAKKKKAQSAISAPARAAMPRPWPRTRAGFEVTR
jgi:hypothetical protein